MYYPALAEYCKLAETYNLIPVYREYPADTETPVSIYHKLSPAAPSFLLESVAGSATLARYSFIGMACFLNFRYTDGAAYWDAAGRAGLHGDPLTALRGLVSRYHTPALPNLPPFISGGVGYFGYDLVRFLEFLPSAKQDDLGLPLCWLMFPAVVLAFDHIRRTLLVAANLPLTGRPEDTYLAAAAKIDQVAKQIFSIGQSPAGYPLRGAPAYSQSLLDDYLLKGAVFGRSKFEAAVSRALDYIRAGDIFQVVLSQRFDLPFDGNPFDFYRWLRLLNPSPYHFYLNFGALTVVGCSPEMLVRVTGPKVTTHPIAGTRPRGSHAAEDDRLAAELLADEKERAEHLMLVDLGRNDLGRVCRPGTVQVPSFMQVERYSHVMHLVSEVTGLLEAGKTGLDALAACFPAGTVSGAPKIRAMEIIDELEPVSRGLYAGAVGYLDFAGQLDTAITIRTAVLHGGKAYLQAGAGIVADSCPGREYQECLHKARAMAAALLAATAGKRGYGIAGSN